MGHATRYALSSPDGLDLVGVIATRVRHRGRWGLRLVEDVSFRGDRHALAVIRDTSFADGEIRLRMAGAPAPDAPPEMRGFVGLAFHIQPGAEAFEAFWLRPTNGRAEDQLRRNHATQYASYPDYPWHRLRQESPGVYESYTDLVPEAWTDVRIQVSGSRARLYVGGAAQPCLIVQDLKHGASSGAIGLWIGSGTVAHFADLRIDGAPG